MRATILVVLAIAGLLAAAPLPLALPNLPPTYDSSVLIAAPASLAPTLDGLVDSAWAAATPVEATAFGGSGSFPAGAGIHIRALYDATTLYMLIDWPDATEDYSRDAWLLTENSTAGGNWTRTTWGDDGIALLWDDGQGLEQNFSASGCGPLCHTGGFTEMRTGAGTLDSWHWSSSFTAPLAYAEDNYLDWASKADGSANGGWHGDGADAKFNNTVTTAYGERPGFLNGTLPVDASGRHIAVADAAPISWVVFNSTSMPKGTTVPGYVLGTPAAPSLDVAGAARWNNSTWTLELSRALTTSDNASRDIAFDDLDATYFFSLGVLDNKTGQNHSTAGFVRKMIFADNALPDLTAEAVTLGQPATLVNDTVNVTVRVRNWGFGDAATATFVAITDNVSATEVANVTVPPIAWSEFFLANLSFSSVGYSVGAHGFTARVDTANSESESFEDNNTRGFEVTIVATTALPDLTVEAATGPTGLVFAGEPFFVNGSVRNVGGGDSVSAVTVRAGHPLFGNLSQGIGTIAAGQPSSFSFLIDSTGVPAGAFAITVTADPADAIAEDDESNNSAVVVVTVEDRSDLVAVELSADPAAGTGGAVLLFNLTVENRGAPFAGSLGVWLYLDDGGSTNGTNRTDVLAFVVDLARGENITVSTNWGIPNLIAPGTHLVRAWIDAGRLIDEVAETNNNASVQIVALIPPRPDLEVTGVSLAATTYRPSEQATLTVNLTNNGVAYAGTVRLEVTEATLNRALGNITIPAIAAGATQTFTITFAVPGGTAGVHSVLVVVDADNALDEEAELNNALSTTFTLLDPALPDLLVTGPSFAPAEPTAGDTVTITATVRNAGNAAAPASTVALAWVSTPIGTVTVPALQPAETFVATFSWNTTGVRTRSAILTLTVGDAGGLDGDLSNNALPFVVAFLQPGIPNLRLSPLTIAPRAVNPGEFVRIEVTVTNDGTAAGSGSVRFVAGSAVLGTTDFTLAAGESRLLTISWTAIGSGNVTVRAEMSSGGSTVATVGGQVAVASTGTAPASNLVLYFAVALAIASVVALFFLMSMRKAARGAVGEADAATTDAAAGESDEEE